MKPICKTCGTQFAEAPEYPTACPICVDDRQFVGWEGQEWTDLEWLQRNRQIRWETEDGGIQAIGVTPGFAIPQRAFVLLSGHGNVLWECISLVNDDVVDRLTVIGGVECIAISHPHFFSSMVEWSEALGDVPIVTHERNKEWVLRPDRRISFWSGDELALLPEITLYCLGGHFPGSAVLHWPGWNESKGALFTADTMHVVADRQSVTFMHSIPNYVPLHPEQVRRMYRQIEQLRYENVYGFTWRHNIIGDGDKLVAASVDRFLSAIGAG